MHKHIVNYFLILIGLSIILVNHSASATTDVVDRAMIGVPPSCTMRGSGMNSHNAEIPNGTINSAIGETNVNIFCNDDAGYAIYAIGYTDDTDGKTVLTSSSLGSGSDIATGTLTSGGNSQWAMKLSTQTSPTPAYPVTIQNSFDSFHAVPSEYTLVAKRTTGTDVGTNATGSNFKTTYQVYVSSSQLAGTYVGQVKYTLVHPNTTPIPKSTMLDEGPTVCAKMKTLAAGTETTCGTATSNIKAIRMADSLPSGFTPSEANTVSTSTSRHPIYIFYDNTNDAGILYFYTGGYQVVMNPRSSQIFAFNSALTDIPGVIHWDSSNATTFSSLFYNDYSLSDISPLANWNTSNVTNLQTLFWNDYSLTNINALTFWDVSNVENMRGIFACNNGTITSGHPSQLSDISGLAFWDTSSVTNMQQLFQDAVSLSDISALFSWDVSSVSNMSYMFTGTAITDVDAIANWDVSSVETMNNMFSIADTEYDNGIRSRLTSISGLANWDVHNVNDMRYMFRRTTSLTDAAAIKNWDVRTVTAPAGSTTSNTNYFYSMFYQSSATPEPFTLRAGTWNSNGTYVPSS